MKGRTFPDLFHASLKNSLFFELSRDFFLNLFYLILV
jgi:hypothetical protein